MTNYSVPANRQKFEQWLMLGNNIMRLRYVFANEKPTTQELKEWKAEFANYMERMNNLYRESVELMVTGEISQFPEV